MPTYAHSLVDTLADRINYYESYISAMNDAVSKDGVQVLGYFAWSLLDNYEWADGYS